MQSAPTAHLVLRSTNLTMPLLESNCDELFGEGTSAAARVRNAELNRRFGAAHPRSGAFPGTSRIFYWNWSDDPWQEASVQSDDFGATQDGHELHYCMSTCDGCGHCGAGVTAEANKHCWNRMENFVASTLEEAKRASHAESGKEKSEQRESDATVYSLLP